MKPSVASALPLLLSVAACSSGPPPRSYVLTPPLERAATPASPVEDTGLSPIAHTAPVVRLVVRRVHVPDYLDTTDIVTRDGRDEIRVSATGRWAERLSEGLTDVLAADLATRLPPDTVVLDASSNARRQLFINVDSLDLWPDGRCVMAATWSIVDHDAPRAVVTGSGTFDASPLGTLPGVGDAHLVEAVSRTVGKLAGSIALTAQQD